jgi:hypothetical protein
MADLAQILPRKTVEEYGPSIIDKWLMRGQNKIDDTRVIEEGQLIINGIWERLSGESVALFGPTKYPNTTAGPLGRMSYSADQAISEANSIVAKARTRIVTRQLANNPFFTNGASGRIGLMMRIRSAREQAGVTGGGGQIGRFSPTGILGSFKGATPILVGGAFISLMVLFALNFGKK